MPVAALASRPGNPRAAFLRAESADCCRQGAPVDETPDRPSKIFVPPWKQLKLRRTAGS
jgi:hypothetical protein